MWLFMPRCVLFGFIHRSMTCELQRVADIYVCVWGGPGGCSKGAIKDSAPLAVLLWR